MKTILKYLWNDFRTSWPAIVLLALTWVESESQYRHVAPEKYVLVACLINLVCFVGAALYYTYYHRHPVDWFKRVQTKEGYGFMWVGLTLWLLFTSLLVVSVLYFRLY